LRTAFGAAARFELAYEPGVELAGGTEAGISAAAAAAQRADLVVLAVGENAEDMTGEASSRTRLDLPGRQAQLLEAVAATGKPVVLIVFSGRPLALTPYVDRVAAIVQAWHPGMQAGPALVDALIGAASFSGRLTLSMPRSVGQLPLYYNALTTGKPIEHVDLAAPSTPVNKYRSRYIDEDNAPLFPFGYGLTYTTFAYGAPAPNAKTLSAKALASGTQRLEVRVKLDNTGARDGVEVAQLYIRMRGTSVALPARQLEGYQRVALRPGESRELVFTLGRDELAFWTLDGQRAVEPCTLSIWVAPDAGSGTPVDVEITE
jgi:beta-glucosidase